MTGKLRNMTSIYLLKDDKVLLLFRKGGRVVSDVWTGSAGGHFEEFELNDAKACVLREMNEELGLCEDNIRNLSLRYVTLRRTKGEIRQNYYFFASLIQVRYGKSDAKHILQKENSVMIDIYTERKDSKDWIFYNDLYFNLNTGNEDMSQKEIDLIQQVDEAKLTPDKHIETKYGLGTIRNLSSGCKTLLNIVKHPDKVVNVEECGPNVLKIIFTMDNIKIYMSRPTLFDIPDDAKIRFNDSDIVTGGRGYNAWWSKEYQRREADDL